MARTASTISGVSFSASVWLSLVERDVRATHSRSSRSTSRSNLKVSKNYRKSQVSTGSEMLCPKLAFKDSVFAIS